MTSEPSAIPKPIHFSLLEQRAHSHRLPTKPDQDRYVDERRAPRRNIVSVARLARVYDLPLVLSTVNAKGGQGWTLPSIKKVLEDNVEIDRSQINSWEDVEFRKAVESTGRKK